MQIKPRTAKAMGLILAFPALVAFQFALMGLDFSGRAIIPVAVLAWFVGPVLFVIGCLMLLPKVRWTVLPSTRLGRISLWLVAGFAAFFGLFVLALASGLGPDNPETFFGNLYPAIPLTLAGACAVAAGVAGGFAILLRRERSLVVVGTLVFGVVVATFTTGEVGGHDEPNRDERRTPTPTPLSTPGTGSNSHSSLTAVRGATSGEVLVSFDYAYNHDPDGQPITAITVSALESNNLPLSGYSPLVRPIARGSGHLELTLSFTPAQLDRLKGFSVCFTAPGRPDLGCATKVYSAD